MKKATFDDLDRWGVLEYINNELLHSLGLKLIKNNDGTSPGCLISDELWFPNTDNKESKQKFQTFIKNRYYYLKNYIDIKEYQEQIEKENKNKLNQLNNIIKEKKLLNQ